MQYTLIDLTPSPSPISWRRVYSIQLKTAIYNSLNLGGIFIFDIATSGQVSSGTTAKGFTEGKDWIVRNGRNCQNTQLVRDTENIVTTFRIVQSVTAPYKKNMRIA
ncbi:type 12 methyltransferase [Calothrix parasitica NIES-267]|uniref:Type 12 methyltransferase n=1 Tax=Calothrix parasitica NIES-267 TaxID=1973488 RepID=A0A1Z4M1V1_9CYAN|nr:type 12 methyltransferase [Calothrix parasitica NIES-267]